MKTIGNHRIKIDNSMISLIFGILPINSYLGTQHESHFSYDIRNQSQVRRINPFYLPPSDALQTISCTLTFTTNDFARCVFNEKKGQIFSPSYKILMLSDSFGETHSHNRIQHDTSFSEVLTLIHVQTLTCMHVQAGVERGRCFSLIIHMIKKPNNIIYATLCDLLSGKRAYL